MTSQNVGCEKAEQLQRYSAISVFCTVNQHHADSQSVLVCLGNPLTEEYNVVVCCGISSMCFELHVWCKMSYNRAHELLW